MKPGISQRIRLLSRPAGIAALYQRCESASPASRIPEYGADRRQPHPRRLSLAPVPIAFGDPAIASATSANGPRLA
jgi:hypothetical protein